MKSQSKIPRVLSQGNEMEMRKTVIAPVIRRWAYMDITLYQKKYGIIMASLCVDRSCCYLLMVPVERRSSEWLLLCVILFSWFGLPNYYIMQIFLEESGFNIFSIFFFSYCMYWNLLDIFGLMPHVVNLLVKYYVVFSHCPICKHLNTNMLLPTNKNVTLQYNRPISFQASHGAPNSTGTPEQLCKWHLAFCTLLTESYNLFFTCCEGHQMKWLRSSQPFSTMICPPR